MELELTLLFVVCLAVWCYRDGKRTGSRLGFNAGRRKQLRKRHRPR